LPVLADSAQLICYASPIKSRFAGVLHLPLPVSLDLVVAALPLLFGLHQYIITMLFDLSLAIVIDIVEQFHTSLLTLLPLLVLLDLFLLPFNVDQSVKLLLIVYHILSSILKA
jgi:hypothetical protein